MHEPLSCAPKYRHVLLVSAAPAEAAAVAAGFGHAGPAEDWLRVSMATGWSLVRSGVGKVNGAVCVARCLGEKAEPETLVVNVGVCGALPRVEGMLPNGTVVVGDASAYADEGVASESGFADMAAMGFEYWPGARDSREPGGCSAIPADTALVDAVASRLRQEIGTGVAVGRIATVSTCSGTEALARDIAGRTGGIAEAMEGAAIGHALTRMRVGDPGFLELRVVSNTTGERITQQWDLKGALAMLTRVVSALRSPEG
jgi:futalosine hydrolase